MNSGEYSPTSSETLVFIGAGATAQLGMPSTGNQTNVFRELSSGKDITELLRQWFIGDDLNKVLAFLKFLDGKQGCSILDVSDDDIAHSEIAFGTARDERLLKQRILELRQQYDWNALKKIIGICPHNENKDNLIRDVYSIIDKKLLAHQSLKVKGGADEEILPVARLQGARNFLVLFTNMLFAGAWNNITKGELADEFSRYKNFINSFDRLMQREGMRFLQKGYGVEQRDFYLFSTSFISFNFEMAFPWILMKSHHELNHMPPYVRGDHPIKLWLDYGCEHRGRKKRDGTVVSTLEFTESVASRENEEDHIGTPLNRCGKFLFAHGSSNWRECPVCGRMTFYFGYSDKKWQYKSKELISPFPIPLFGMNRNDGLTKQEKEWRKQLRFDSLQCMHCGSETTASDAPMIMQSMYKSTPTSFLEEIQRNVKVSLEKARHVILMGYQLPTDDTVWQQTFAEAVRSRLDSGTAAFCSVVVGHKGVQRWLYEDELSQYADAHRQDKDAEGFGVPAIDNAIAIFGKDKVRAWTGGIPQVFGNCTERDVKKLFYPSDSTFANWKGTRIEE